jgi:hypothetical protein
MSLTRKNTANNGSGKDELLQKKVSEAPAVTRMSLTLPVSTKQALEMLAKRYNTNVSRIVRGMILGGLIIEDLMMSDGEVVFITKEGRKHKIDDSNIHHLKFM